MNSLILRLAAPMQSWGAQSRFSVRDTGREPSKSGVVGMLAAALGRARGDDIDDLMQLCMAVRVDRDGSLKPRLSDRRGRDSSGRSPTEWLKPIRRKRRP